MKKVFYTWNDIERMCSNIIVQMYNDKWTPDYIVGITRGGLIPATILSNTLNIPMHTLDVRLRDTEGLSEPEHNLWMSKDAFGYNDPEKSGVTGARWDPGQKKKILIVDDINDTGATFNWIKHDWQESCMPDEEQVWNCVWNKTVKFAVLTQNIASEFDIDYYSDECNKLEQPLWQVYPWEVVGKYEVRS